MVDFFLRFGAYPVGIFYEENENLALKHNIDEEHWKSFEKNICINELYPDIFRTYISYDQCVCFYCENVQRIKDSVCSLCGEAKVQEMNE